jgi:surface protein
MFQHCNKLETLDLSSFNVSNVTNMKEMFKDMNNLKTIYVSESFNTNNVTNSQEMFK